MPRPSGHGPTLGGSASRRAATRVKPAQASKVETRGSTRSVSGEDRWIPWEQPTNDHGSLAGVWGVARRHRARCNTGSPARGGVAARTSALRREPCWVSEGRTVPFGLAGQQNRSGGKAPWFGVGFDEPRGGRLA